MNKSRKLKQTNRKFNPFVVGVAIVAIVALLGFCNYKSSKDIQPSQAQVNTEALSNKQSNDKTVVKVTSSKSDALTIQTNSRIALKNHLKDPSSAEIRNHRGICGEVSSKNSFGGYTGFHRFIASPAIVVIEGESVDQDEFQRAWDKLC